MFRADFLTLCLLLLSSLCCLTYGRNDTNATGCNATIVFPVVLDARIALPEFERHDGVLSVNVAPAVLSPGAIEFCSKTRCSMSYSVVQLVLEPRPVSFFPFCSSSARHPRRPAAALARSGRDWIRGKDAHFVRRGGATRNPFEIWNSTHRGNWTGGNRTCNKSSTILFDLTTQNLYRVLGHSDRLPCVRAGSNSTMDSRCTNERTITIPLRHGVLAPGMVVTVLVTLHDNFDPASANNATDTGVGYALYFQMVVPPLISWDDFDPFHHGQFPEIDTSVVAHFFSKFFFVLLLVVAGVAVAAGLLIWGQSVMRPRPVPEYTVIRQPQQAAAGVNTVVFV
eukprot:gnl/Spiro4/1032_TR541_c0_g1_i1.p1 gnl/Spiro4/1032_TR541_c0_g1~~gnl/Spiro4/1032_TR541_c0_g1_i1.p1  ORF type:complete len:358 (+),score=57.16 gnl/Spiro4/1032_TR541_c0_g1_i1:60-1076(+)